MASSRPCSLDPAADAANAEKCVLIVEDNPLNMKLFAAMIEARGYRGLHATEGLQGLDMAHREHPDLIVMDVRLPDISGLEVTHRLKADDNTRDIPIIVTTADEASGQEGRIRASGCDGFIAKPIIIAEFLKLVELFITRPVAVPEGVD